MNRYRRNLRRAREWRWEPPAAETVAIGEEARQHWNEARAKAIAWAAAVAEDPRVVYLDTETTGFGPRAEIVDVAVVSVAGEVLFDSLVRPTRRIPAEVIAIHGITDADVADAPDWEELYDDLRAVLDDRRIVVYNVTFDKQMIAQSCAQYALSLPAADWDCAMKKYAGYYGNWDAGKRWYRFQKLEHAVRAFGAEPGGHRAAADALACRAVVLGMAGTPPPILAAAATPLEARVPERAAVSPTLTGPLPLDGDPAACRSAELIRWSRAARAFILLLEGIPAELSERSGACGTWSPREVAALCAGWEWEAVRRLRLSASHPGLPDLVYDVDRFNAASIAVRGRMNWMATLDDLAKAITALANTAVATIDDTRTREWLTGRAADFEAHGEGLQRWLSTTAATPEVKHLAPHDPRANLPVRLENRDSLA